MSEASKAARWPKTLRYRRAEDMLYVEYPEGTADAIAAKRLREHSPSAEVRGHGAGPRRLAQAPDGIAVSRMVPVGRYAVRLVFSDGHDSGLYTWPFLAELAAAQRAEGA